MALGRALIKKPGVFLFDEPLSNLDAKLRGQVRTEIGNKLGEAAQYYDMANEQKASKANKSAAASTSKRALDWLRGAALESGKGYAEKATPTSITKWEGSADIENTSDARQWGQPTLEMKDAEGASSKLRKWEG